MIDWPRIWNDDTRRLSPVRITLSILSLIYGQAVSLRNRLYDTGFFAARRLPCPVVSVGNITVGGTGKTPCVILIAKMLQAQGYRPAVISRGYGGKSKAPVHVVSDGKTIPADAGMAGDEPLLIARALPGVAVITGAKRVNTAPIAIERFGADVILCDDAFQHRRIFRDINLVLLDFERPLGNGHLLPRGELRESPTGLCRADAFVLTRAATDKPIAPEISGIAQKNGIPVFRARHQAVELLRGNESERLPVKALRGKKVCAFCGIARPDSFETTLLASGAELLSFLPYPDHHDFDPFDLAEIQNKFNACGADYLVTTQKDAARLAHCPDFLNMIWVVRMEMEMMDNQATFEAWLTKRLKAARRG
ncbi:MAG: tetraacyldisaccharide 4'-kinase [Smithellaceae bacterium]